MEITNAVKKNEKRLIKSIQELIQINSVKNETPVTIDAPFGKGVKDSLLYVLKLGKEMGFEVKLVDNVAGHIDFGQGDEVIAVLGHVDVVPTTGDWDYPPFSGKLVDGKIYGRGALDDKGPVVCALYAMKVLKDLGFVPKKKVRLIIGTDEESGWECMRRYARFEKLPEIGFSPDASFPVIHGEKGIMSIDLVSSYLEDDVVAFTAGDRYNVVPDKAEALIKKNLEHEFLNYLKENDLKGEFSKENSLYKLTVYGKTAHGSAPYLGVNAAIKLACFLSEYLTNPVVNFVSDKMIDPYFRGIGLDYQNEKMGHLTVNLAKIEINPKGNKIGLNLRYPIDFPKEEFLKKLHLEISEYGFKFEVLSDSVPHYVDPNEELVQILYNSYKKYTNDEENKPFTIGGGTYARILKKGVSFGPTFAHTVSNIHQPNEYITVEDCLLGTIIYADAIKELSK
jgi:succinyl-diaminopimelate desuccinylase